MADSITPSDSVSLKMMAGRRDLRFLVGTKPW
jgi:hypothetical protein